MKTAGLEVELERNNKFYQPVLAHNIIYSRAAAYNMGNLAFTWYFTSVYYRTNTGLFTDASYSMVGKKTPG